MLAIGVTAGGWAFGFIQMQRADDTDGKLATAQTDLLQLEKLRHADRDLADRRGRSGARPLP